MARPCRDQPGTSGRGARDHAQLDIPLIERPLVRQRAQSLCEPLGKRGVISIGVEHGEPCARVHDDLVPAEIAGVITVVQTHVTHGSRCHGCQVGRVVDVDAQGKAALLGRQAAGPVAGAQRHACAIDFELELFGDQRRELPDIGVAFSLGRRAIAIPIGAMQFPQSRQLPIDHDVMDSNRVGSECQAAKLIDREIAEQARDGIGVTDERREPYQREQPGGCARGSI